MPLAPIWKFNLPKHHVKVLGDLDNDGKTDFVIQTPTLPYNELGGAIGLYLSSRSDKEDLVKLVAYFISTGC